MPIIHCDFCQKEFHLKPSQIKKNKNHYCSRNCCNKHKSNKIKIICHNCNISFERISSFANKSKIHFCSLSCKNEFSRKHNKIIIYNDYAELLIISPKYGKKIILIDIEDIENIKKHTWGVRFDPKMNNFYANCAKFNGSKNKALHRFVMNTPFGMVVDHINHNTLDNRKSNLKNCKQIINMQNMFHKSLTSTNVLHIGYLKNKNLYSVKMSWNRESKQTFVTSLSKAFKARENFYKYFETKYNSSPRKIQGRM